jgi:signal transduction histidine kinase
LPTIKADQEKLKVALANIIDNAVKYTSKGGVLVKTETADSKVLISVKDTGMGIPKEEQKYLFDRTFERGKGAKQANATGKGIGLYITYHIIKAHDGKIWVESEGKGKGATFYIELPTGSKNPR